MEGLVRTLGGYMRSESHNDLFVIKSVGLVWLVEDSA